MSRILKQSFIAVLAFTGFLNAVTPGTERLFVIADVPLSVRFDKAQTYAKNAIDSCLRPGAFSPSLQHLTLLQIGDVPFGLVTPVEQAVAKVVNNFFNTYGRNGLINFWVRPRAHFLGKNAIVMDVEAPQAAHALANALYNEVLPIFTPEFNVWIPHITLGYVPLTDIGAPCLPGIFNSIYSPEGARGAGDTFSLDSILICKKIKGGYQTLREFKAPAPVIQPVVPQAPRPVIVPPAPQPAIPVAAKPVRPVARPVSPKKVQPKLAIRPVAKPVQPVVRVVGPKKVQAKPAIRPALKPAQPLRPAQKRVQPVKGKPAAKKLAKAAQKIAPKAKAKAAAFIKVQNRAKQALPAKRPQVNQKNRKNKSIF